VLLLVNLLPRAVCASAADEQIVESVINHLERVYLYGELQIRDVTIDAAEALARFYGQRRFEPIWFSSRGELRRAGQLREAIADGASHGLTVERYHLAAVDTAAAAGRWGDAELLLSQAFLSQARHRILGVVDPAGVDPDWRLRQNRLDEADLLEALGRGANPRRLLNRLWPKARGYWQLLEARADLDAAAGEPELPPVPDGTLLAPGTDDPRVPLIRARLGLSPKEGERYDSELALAIRDLQRSVGLEPDARIGPNTLAVINRRRAERLLQIDANLERWRWLPEAFPDRYVVVNIADYSLLAVERGRTALAMDVIVGRTYRQTPVFTETMKYLVINPFWEVPTRLARQDELPRLRADPERMARLGFEAALGSAGPMVPVNRIDWREVGSQTPFRLRQRPGPDNPLGRIKFMLPNEFAVYLHDTPARGLFDRTERSFSSGCIRLAEATVLAEWVLGRQHERWDRARLEEAMASGRTQSVVLEEPVPVYIVYFTAYVDASGELLLLHDLYDRDRKVIAALTETVGAQRERKVAENAAPETLQHE
jgi:murein L,D-transpeptidase YcbB/YkuD